MLLSHNIRQAAAQLSNLETKFRAHELVWDRWRAAIFRQEYIIIIARIITMVSFDRVRYFIQYRYARSIVCWTAHGYVEVDDPDLENQFLAFRTRGKLLFLSISCFTFHKAFGWVIRMLHCGPMTFIRKAIKTTTQTSVKQRTYRNREQMLIKISMINPSSNLG